MATSEVRTVTVADVTGPTPTVVSTGDDPGAPTVIGTLPPAYDLSGARVVSYPQGGPSWEGQAVPLTDAPTIVTNAALGRMFEVTLHGNRILANPINLSPDQRITWRLIQDGTGSRLLALGSMFNVNFTVTGPIVLSTTPGTVDYLGGIYRPAANKIDVLAFGRGF